MKDFLTKWYVKAQIFREDNGQDLIEYALVVALIAFAATVGMATVATRINAAFVAIGNKVTSYTTLFGRGCQTDGVASPLLDLAGNCWRVEAGK
jgi:pilus assembly protein Flp/PilA